MKRTVAKGSGAEKYLTKYDAKVNTEYVAPIGIAGTNDVQLSYEVPDVPARSGGGSAPAPRAVKHLKLQEVSTPAAERALRQALAEATFDGAEMGAITPRETLQYARDQPIRAASPPHARTDVAPVAGMERTRVRAVPGEAMSAKAGEHVVEGEASTPILLDREPRYIADDGVLRKIHIAKHGQYTHEQSDHIPKVNEEGYGTGMRNFAANVADFVHAGKLRDKLRPEQEAYDMTTMSERQRNKLAHEMVEATTPTMRVDESEVISGLEA